MTEGWVEYLTGPYGFAFAFAAGIISFLSPCVLPIVPAYLAHLTGTAATLAPGQRDHRRTTVTHAAAFVLGFTAVFTLLGASTGLIGALASGDNSYFIKDNHLLLARTGGIFLIIIGLNVIGVIKIPLLHRTYSFESMGGPVAAGAGGGTVALGTTGVQRAGLHGLTYAKSFGVGAAFAIGWTPCIGPVLGAILTLSATSSSVTQGSYLLLVYSLGLGVPFMVTALAVVPITRFLRRIRGVMPLMEITAGALVIFVGVLIFSNQTTTFNQYFGFFDRFSQI